MDTANATALRTCTKCGGDPKPLDQFGTRKRKDGTTAPTAWCRSCLCEYGREYMREHLAKPEVREQHREADRERYHRNKDDPTFHAKRVERSARYRADPDVARRNAERATAWRLANPGRNAANHAAWRSANKEKVAEYSRRSHAKDEDYKIKRAVVQGERRWRKFNQGYIGFTIWHARLILSYWGYRCAYCGGPLAKTAGTRKDSGLDHVIALKAGGGHAPDNLIASCTLCNFQKGRREPPEAVLRLLDPHMDALLPEIPPEAWDGEGTGGHRPRGDRLRILQEAEAKLRGRGSPIGKWWQGGDLIGPAF
jgi:hypothetical protein